MRKFTFVFLSIFMLCITSMKSEVLIVTSTADSGEGSLRSMAEKAVSGDSIVLPGESTITLLSTITFTKDLAIEGNLSTIQVENPGVSNYKLLVFDVKEAKTATNYSIHNLNIIGGNISDMSASSASNVAFCGAGITASDYVIFSGDNLNFSQSIGNYSGAFFSNGSNMQVYLTNCTFANNQGVRGNGGALILKGKGSIKNCTFENNTVSGQGGAISSYGAYSMSNCTFKNNVAKGSAGGGAIVNYCTSGLVEINSSYFENNSCEYTGSTGAGAVVITNVNAQTIISNCTFYKNKGPQAGAIGICSANSTVNANNHTTCVNNTIIGNESTKSLCGGLAITNKSTTVNHNVNLVNNIIAYNYNADGLSDVTVETGKAITLKGSNNIFGTFAGENTLENNIPFSYDTDESLFVAYMTEPKKMPVVADNGGMTMTAAISTESAAYQSGVFSYGSVLGFMATDQIGINRASTPCIGAFEYPLVSKTWNVTTTEDDGEGSLRDIVSKASCGDVVNLPKDAVITLLSTITLNKDLTIEGNNTSIRVETPGVSKYKLLLFKTKGYKVSTEYTVHNLNLIAGDVSESHATASNILNCGAGITVEDYVIFTGENLHISKGIGYYAGGFFTSNTNNQIFLTNCTFSDNKGLKGNGGALIVKGVGYVKNCLFENNEISGHGSAIAAYGTYEIVSCTFRNNLAHGSVGGAIVNYNETGKVSISGCLFDNNVCDYQPAEGAAVTGTAGVAVPKVNAITHIINNTFYNNKGPQSGAISVYGTNSTNKEDNNTTIINNTIVGNESTCSMAGGVVISGTSTVNHNVNMANNLIAYNYNANGLCDMIVEPEKAVTLIGTNNLIGSFTGENPFENNIAFNYDSDNNLFANYTTDTNKKPVLADNGGATLTVAITSSGAAYQSGIVEFLDSNLVPVIDQRGEERGVTPCIGAFELTQEGTNILTKKENATILYPTLVSDYLFATEDILSAKLYNAAGTCLRTYNNPGKMIAVNDMPAGMYLIAVQTATGNYVHRFMITGK